MRSLAGLGLGLVLTLSAGTVDSARSWSATPLIEASGAPASDAGSGTAVIPEAEGASLEVWFALDSGLLTEAGQVATRSGLFRAVRTLQGASPGVDADVLTAQAALTALLAGPDEQETAAGVYSAIPAGTELLGLSVADGVVSVDLGSSFVADADREGMLLRLAQVVYTTAQSPAVEGVDIRLDDASVEVLRALGLELDGVQTRDEHAEQLPAILVERPAIGEPVSGSVTVSGTADVFEGTVSMRLLDAAGVELARAFTTATCGSGCRGEFSRRLRFEVAAAGQGTLEVFEASALDGSDTNIVRIPLVLLP